jgi:hypothetical protein
MVRALFEGWLVIWDEKDRDTLGWGKQICQRVETVTEYRMTEGGETKRRMTDGTK